VFPPYGNPAPVVGTFLFGRNQLHLASLQQIVGGLIEPVSQGLDGVHHCYVNEKGLLGDRQYFFLFKNGHQPLASNGVEAGRGDCNAASTRGRNGR
jgi:hypothetical protein